MANLLIEIGNTALKASWSEGMTLGKTFRYQGEKVIDFILSLTAREKAEVMVVASADDNRYWIFMLLPDVTISMARFSGQLQTMYDFFHNQADLQISVYADPSPVTIFGTISNLDSWDKKNISRMKGVFYQNPMISVKEEASDPIAEAIEYIKSHLHQNITRTET